MRELAVVRLREGEQLPSRELCSEVYHRASSHAGAYSMMYYHSYPLNLVRGKRFAMTPGAAIKFVKRLPQFEIETVIPRLEWEGE